RGTLGRDSSSCGHTKPRAKPGDYWVDIEPAGSAVELVGTVVNHRQIQQREVVEMADSNENHKRSDQVDVRHRQRRAGKFCGLSHF
ncbi:hypothetical protein, partial [Pseudomonas amygdali]|uniref:hypothetical protein n=1 Tax=Pseudomonas amygdali TaxID=47877 RepID=UPI001CB8F7B0